MKVGPETIQQQFPGGLSSVHGSAGWGSDFGGLVSAQMEDRGQDVLGLADAVHGFLIYEQVWGQECLCMFRKGAGKGQEARLPY